MTKIFLVGAGGFIGASFRYLLSGWVMRLFSNPTFPWGTLTVNVLGCLVIGFLAGIGESRQVLSAETRAFLMIGVLGGLTTFSSFGYETFTLLRDGEFLRSLGNVLLHVTVALGSVWVGFYISGLFGVKS